MASEMKLHEYKQLSFKKPMVIVGFPSAGLVSSIAANFVVRTLKLEKIATILHPEFPPYALVHEGEISPPVRIYAGSRVCDGTGEECEQLIVITTEFMPAPHLLRPLSDAIVEYCRRNDVNTIVALEGMNVGESPEKREVLAIATGERCRRMLEKYGMKELKEGMVSGISGVLLYDADRLGLDLICLLGPARMDYPDARGAARLIENVAKMLPELKLDPEPLFKEAEQIEKDMRAAVEGLRQAQRPSEESVIYS
ncbi:MAG TPA: PAC2 family protein [Methanomassiliicoccales archaeon]|nr:PAC2 family protein [Methanomassiliicoccales archaeon]